MTESWIKKRRKAGYDFGDLVEAVSELVVTPTDHDGDPVEGSVTVDTVALIGENAFGPRYWQLDYVGGGLWEHRPSGTGPAPLVELLLTIALVSRTEDPS